MNASQPAKLLLNGNLYDLSQVIRKGKAGPEVICQRSDFNDGSQKEHVVGFVPDQLPAGDTGVIIYKQGGKFTILAGAQLLSDLEQAKKFKGFKCRLISGPVLKTCRIEHYPTDPAFVSAVAGHDLVLTSPHQERPPLRADLRDHQERPLKQFPKEFANTPRIIDNRQPRLDRPREYGYSKDLSHGLQQRISQDAAARKPPEEPRPAAPQGSFVDQALRRAGHTQRVI